MGQSPRRDSNSPSSAFPFKDRGTSAPQDGQRRWVLHAACHRSPAGHQPFGPLTLQLLRAGSQPWEGRHQAFPHLMHHPGFIQTENYGSQREFWASAPRLRTRSPAIRRWADFLRPAARPPAPAQVPRQPATVVMRRLNQPAPQAPAATAQAPGTAPRRPAMRRGPDTCVGGANQACRCACCVALPESAAGHQSKLRGRLRLDG